MKTRLHGKVFGATHHGGLGLLGVPAHQRARQPAHRAADDGVLVLVPLVGQPAALKSLETSQDTGGSVSAE